MGFLPSLPCLCFPFNWARSRERMVRMQQCQLKTSPGQRAAHRSRIQGYQALLHSTPQSCFHQLCLENLLEFPRKSDTPLRNDTAPSFKDFPSLCKEQRKGNSWFLLGAAQPGLYGNGTQELPLPQITHTDKTWRLVTFHYAFIKNRASYYFGKYACVCTVIW